MESPGGLRLQREDMSLRKRAEKALRDAILYGAFQPGQKLIERDLCEQLGVSRTLLREALQQLQAEGLITNVIHKGPSVAVITEEDAREIYEARQLIEGHLAAISMVAKTKAPWAVFLGAALALCLVSFLGVMFGEALTRYVPEQVLKTISAVSFIVIGGLMLWGKL